MPLNGSAEQKIDLMEIVAEARERKLPFPLTVRFHDLLRDRVKRSIPPLPRPLRSRAIKEQVPRVFPIKVKSAARSGGGDFGCRTEVAFWH